MNIRRHLLLGVLCCCQWALWSQQSLCGGATGDPVINIDFGSGPNFGAPLPPGTTNYKYIYGYPDDGFYTLANILGPPNNDWHKTPDHTPNDYNGYALVVNASFAPGEFYRQRIDGLCDNSVYEFSAWITVLNIPNLTPCKDLILPNVKFQVQDLTGKVLGEIITGNIPASNTVDWKRLGFSFSTPVGQSDVVVVMINNAPGGCGNDLAIDDIMFRSCGDQLTLTSTPSLAIPICHPDSLHFKVALGPGYTTPLFRWQKTSPTDTTQWETLKETNQPTFSIFHDTPDIRYRVLVANSQNALDNPFCRVSSNLVAAKIAPPPDFSLRITHSCGPANGSLDLTPTLGPAPFKYTWSNGAKTEDIKRLVPGFYQVTLTDAYGCVKSGQAEIDLQGLEPPVTLTGDTVINLGSSTSLALESSRDSVHFRWQPSPSLSCLDCASTVALPPRDTIYTYYYTTPERCTFSDSVFIKVVRGPLNIYVPNIFTPNGDNINDHFTVLSGHLVSQVELLRVYDRWGELVFEQKNYPPNDLSNGWNGAFQGKIVDQGVFVWYAVVKLIDGSMERLSGEVTVVPN